MKVQHLQDTPFDELLDCFLKAFENYYVKMPTDTQYYRKRWKAAMVDFSASYGMFDEGKLIGFIIHAIDTRNGMFTAFNVGTGVLPAYRGKRVINTIYQTALVNLKERGIERIALEVITENKVAISAYKAIGLKICKEYKCFLGLIKVEEKGEFELKKVDASTIQWDTLPNQEYYSWENQKESLLSGNYSYFQVLHNNKVESFFIMIPESGYVAQFDIMISNNDSWNRLFSAIEQISINIKINNVDIRLTEKIKQLQRIGLENKIDQFEMELKI